MRTAAEIQTAWAILLTTPDTARQLAANTTTQIAEVRNSDQWAVDYKRQLIDQHRATATNQLTALRSQVDQARATLLAAAADADRPAGFETTQLLAELRTQRAWARLRALLDSGRDWQTLVSEAEQAGDQAAIRALTEELPAWLRARAPMTLGGQEPDLTEVTQRLDVANVRVFGDNLGHGYAARLRLHVAARYPLAVATLDAAGRAITSGGSLADSYATTDAEQAAARIEALIAVPASV